MTAPSAADWVLLLYLGTVVTGLLRAPEGASRDAELRYVSCVAVAFLGWILGFRMLVDRRCEGRQPAFWILSTYRLMVVPTILLVYFHLRAILPLLNHADYDADLYRLDERLFGVAPTLAVAAWATPRVVEWFSFFYYSYFYLIAAFTLSVALLDPEARRDGRRPVIFGTALLLVFCVGQAVYALVPGYGPITHLSGRFEHPLEGGFFYGVMVRAVALGGAQRDIFPSLHTAVPTLCALFAWKHYRRFAIPATFWAVNIVGATLVLRWHWAVDILAGLTLATLALLVAPRIVDAYQRLRRSGGTPPDCYW